MTNAALPLYVPLIHHRGSRTQPLDIDVVALPTSGVASTRRNGYYGPRSTTPAALRAEFAISERTKVLLASVKFDEPLEIYWEKRRKYATPGALSKLGLLGMTVPNFSFFDDAPRPHTIWNRARMVRLAEELSNAGVPVVLHLNALTAADWAFWTSLLRQNSTMAYVVKEFQTGNRDRQEGTNAVNALRELQYRVGRTIHPIAVGGAQFVRVLRKEFARFTIIDSNPFMRTMHRSRIVVHSDGNRTWRPFPTEEGEPLDELLTYNIRRYAWALALEAADAAKGSKNQLSLPLSQESGLLR